MGQASFRPKWAKKVPEPFHNTCYRFSHHHKSMPNLLNVQ